MADAAATNNSSDRDEGYLAILTNAVSKPTQYLRMTPPDVLKDQVSNWTKTKSPVGGHIKAAMANVTVASHLHKGIQVTKVTSYGKQKSRVLTISEDRFALFVTHHRIKGSIMSGMARTLPLPRVSRKGIRGFGRRDVRSQYVRYIDVADLQGVQVGVVGTPKLEQARDQLRLKGYDSKVDEKQKTIVTIFHHGNHTLDVMIEDDNDRAALVSTLLEMQETYRRAQDFVVPESRLLRYLWYDLDADKNGEMSAKEFAKLLNRINVYLKDPTKVYNDFKKEKGISGELNYRQIMDLLTRIQQGKIDEKNIPVTLNIFTELFGNEDYVSAQDFLANFLHGHQGETDATLDEVNTIFANVNIMELNRDESSLPVKQGYLSKHRFAAFLHSSVNNAYNPDALELHATTLDKSISQYWINTSHNTYLTGDQLQSTSSVYMYVKALRRGCKCLELDCWDGEVVDEKPNPIVYHGHTITTKILFKDIIQVVNAYVLAHPDTYPIILSLENHCSIPFQQVMVDCMKGILGDKLYIPPADVTKDAELPSPEAMKGKVVIKGKRPPDPDDAPLLDDATEEMDPYSERPSEHEGTNNKASPSKDTATGSPAKEGEVKSSAKAHSKILPELADITLFHGTKFHSFEESIESPPSHMHSIGETKITKIVSKSPDSPKDWRHYNLRHMTRTYPAGSRVDSSNYNPVLAWAMGCQLVALNFQTSDAPLMLNDGRFRQNGECGYLLKPEAVLGTGPRAAAVPLKIRVVSGTCLPKPDGDTEGETIDPYVIVTVEDVVFNGDKEEYKVSTHSTATINDNGFSPVWNESEFHDFEVQYPEVAMVQFALWESDVTLDDKVANASIPFSCLRRGYRSVQLYDMNNTRNGPFGMASLLVEIDY